MGTASVAVAGDDGDSAIEPRVRQRLALTRTEALHEKGLAAYVTSFVVAVLLVIGVGDQVSAARRLTWATMVVTLTAVRVLFLHYRSRPAPGAGIPTRRFALGAAASGLVWGSAALLLWPPAPGMYRALMGFAVGGMVAGATAFWSVYLPAYYLFAATALTPLAVRLLSTGQRVDLAMGLMVVAFGVTMSELARRSERWFRSQTELRVRNDILVAHLSEARDLLEHRVADRTTALQESVEQLRAAEADALRAVEVRDQFLAVASHELRTPLTVLTLSLLRFDRQLAAPGPLDRPGLQGSTGILRRQVLRLTGLVDSMLDASGLPLRALTLQARELDLAALVRSVVGDLTTAAEDGAAAVRLELQEPLVGHWDPGRIEQVVVNLVSNAMKFASGKPVEVGLAADHAEVVLSVRDHGPGIDPAIRDRIFERFFRANAAKGGLGLGLAVVRETVEAMGGSVTVASEPGHGALFTVHLPHAPPPRREPAQDK